MQHYDAEDDDCCRTHGCNISVKIDTENPGYSDKCYTGSKPIG